ncbi:MAG: P1 family peptidase, partial [Chloroflexota bacterium]|nr:P1 family peptidase [Chloroflexota bacterium]
SSGDLLIAFSNAPENRVDRFETRSLLTHTFINDAHLNDLFQATIEATAEAVLNALIAAETMTGRDGNIAHALPHDRLQAIMRQYGRLR